MLKIIGFIALTALIWNFVPYGRIIDYVIIGALVIRGLKTVK